MEQQPMTEAMYYVLLALLRPLHGYGLMQRIRQLSGGRMAMSPGTLYGILSRLQREGLIRLEEQGARRKTYALTREGKTALKAEYDRLCRLVQDGAMLKEEEG